MVSLPACLSVAFLHPSDLAQGKHKPWHQWLAGPGLGHCEVRTNIKKGSSQVSIGNRKQYKIYQTCKLWHLCQLYRRNRRKPFTQSRPYLIWPPHHGPLSLLTFITWSSGLPKSFRQHWEGQRGERIIIVMWEVDRECLFITLRRGGPSILAGIVAWKAWFFVVVCGNRWTRWLYYQTQKQKGDKKERKNWILRGKPKESQNKIYYTCKLIVNLRKQPPIKSPLW